MMIEMIMMIAALAIMVNSVKIKIAPTKNWKLGFSTVVMDMNKEYDAEVATNQPDYEKKQKIFTGGTIGYADDYVLEKGEYVITRFKVTADVIKEWTRGDGGWPCSDFRGHEDKGLWIVCENNGDLVNASWSGDKDFDVTSDELDAFIEWAIFGRPSRLRWTRHPDCSCGIHIK